MTTFIRAKSLLARFLFCANAACILAVVVFQSVSPLSKIGQFLFWPQNFLPFLHLSPNSPGGARITFFILVVLLTACMVVILSMFTEMKIAAMSGGTPGLLSVAGPLIGLLLVVPLGRTATILMLIQTICLVSYVWYCWRKRRRPKARESIVMTLLFGWWMYLYHAYMDPLFFSVPLIGCCSYLAWAFWETESWPRQETMASDGNRSDGKHPLLT